MKTNSVTIFSTFAALRHRNFRLWFVGQLISVIGSWMQTAAQGYLVYTLTQSSAYLGYIAFASGLPSFLFLLYGGVVADRVSRRGVILATQVVMMVFAFVLAGLVFTGLVQAWHLVVLSFLVGTARAFEIPARQSFVADLVNREDLTNAIALNVVMFNVAMIVGPAIAGLVYLAAGPALCFAINGVSYLAVIAALMLMKIPPKLGSRQSSALAAIRESIHYVRHHPRIANLTLGAFFYNIFDYAMIIFIPAFAVKMLNGDATTNGLLLAVNAGGAVLGGLLLASLAGRIGRGKLLLFSIYITPWMIFGFALSGVLPLSLLFTLVIGVTSITVLNNINAIIQSTVSEDQRGRVMSLYSLMIMGGGPLGAMLLGWIADWIGVYAIVLICAGMALLFAGWVRFLAPSFRQIE